MPKHTEVLDATQDNMKKNHKPIWRISTNRPASCGQNDFITPETGLDRIRS